MPLTADVDASPSVLRCVNRRPLVNFPSCLGLDHDNWKVIKVMNVPRPVRPSFVRIGYLSNKCEEECFWGRSAEIKPRGTISRWALACSDEQLEQRRSGADATAGEDDELMDLLSKKKKTEKNLRNNSQVKSIKFSFVDDRVEYRCVILAR